jgi:hypothetical protein
MTSDANNNWCIREENNNWCIREERRHPKSLTKHVSDKINPFVCALEADIYR